MKLCHGLFRLNVRKRFFTEREVHQHQACRKEQLEDTQSCDLVLGSPVRSGELDPYGSLLMRYSMISH